MGKTIAVSNQKGGVGKTTTAVNLSAALAKLGKKILLVDLDSQANATMCLDVDSQLENSAIYKMITGSIETKKAIVKTALTNIDIIPGSRELAAVDITMGNVEDYQQELKKQLVKIKSKYDYIILDCPPSLGVVNTMALTAANSILIPIQTEHFAMEGIQQLFSTIRLVQRLFNKELGIEGILVTMFDPRTNLSREIKDLIQQSFGNKAFKAFIPRNVRLAEAPSFRKTIFEHDENSVGAKAYKKLAKELVKNNE